MTVPVEFESADQPAFLQVKSDILAKIAAGTLSPGQRLSDERSLAREYSVSRTTIRRALKHLANDQVIERLRGSGTYVKDNDARVDRVVAIFYGREMPGNEYLLLALSLLERELSAGGLDMLFRPYLSEDVLQAGLAELNDRTDIRGGIVLSANTVEEMEQIRNLAGFPLVLMGDMAASDRGQVVIDQVTAGNHRHGFVMAEQLISRGARRLAMVMVSNRFVWSLETSAGFRDACGRAPGVSGSIYTIQAPGEETLIGTDALDLLAWAERLVGEWLRTDTVPDGVVVRMPWPARVLARAFAKAGLTGSRLPQFSQLMMEGPTFEPDPPDLRMVIVRAEYGALMRRALQRLEEVRGNGDDPRLEIIMPGLTIEQRGYET